MNTATATSTHSLQYYRQKEKAVFDTIPGMRELQQATDEEQFATLQTMYPDAAFALMTASNLFCHDKDMNDIRLKAYRAILDGEPVNQVRFRYDFDLEAYLEKHLWDD